MPPDGFTWEDIQAGEKPEQPKPQPPQGFSWEEATGKAPARPWIGDLSGMAQAQADTEKQAYAGFAAPKELPRGYVGEGKGYQGGFDWRWQNTNPPAPVGFNQAAQPVPEGFGAAAPALPQQARREIADQTPSSFTPGDVHVPGQGWNEAVRRSGIQGLASGAAGAIAAPAEIARARYGSAAQDILGGFDKIDAGASGAQASHGRSLLETAAINHYRLASPEQRAQMRAEQQGNVAAVAQPTQLERTAAGLESSARTAYPVDAGQRGFGTTAAGMFGQMVPMIGAGIATGGVGALSVAGLQTYHGTREEALAKGATPQQADLAATQNALAATGIFATPIGRAARMVLPQLAQSGVVQAVLEMGVKSGEFSVASALQKVVENQIKRTTYDPKQDLMDGVGEAGVAGAVTGAAFGAPHVAGAVSNAMNDGRLPLNAPNLFKNYQDAQNAARGAQGPPLGLAGPPEAPGAAPGAPPGGTPPGAPPGAPTTPASDPHQTLINIATGKPPNAPRFDQPFPPATPRPFGPDFMPAPAAPPVPAPATAPTPDAKPPQPPAPAPPAAAPDPKQEAATQATEQQSGVMIFRSGANAPNDFRAYSEMDVPVGISLASLGPGSATNQMLIDYARQGGHVFIDSGAFSAFTKGTPVDFDAVLTRQLALAQEVPGARLHFVMPDVIGDQGKTLDLLSQHAPKIQQLIGMGHDVLIPLQKGSLTPQAVWQMINQTLGTTDWTAAIPFNKVPYTHDDLRALYQGGVGPDRIHLLGIAGRQTYLNKTAELLRSLNPNVQISADASRLNAGVGEGRPITEGQRTGLAGLMDDLWNGSRPGMLDETELADLLHRPDFWTPQQARSLAGTLGVHESEWPNWERAAKDGELGELADEQDGDGRATMHWLRQQFQAEAEKAARDRARTDAVQKHDQQTMPQPAANIPAAPDVIAKDPLKLAMWNAYHTQYPGKWSPEAPPEHLNAYYAGFGHGATGKQSGWPVNKGQRKVYEAGMAAGAAWGGRSVPRSPWNENPLTEAELSAREHPDVPAAAYALRDAVRQIMPIGSWFLPAKDRPDYRIETPYRVASVGAHTDGSTSIGVHQVHDWRGRGAKGKSMRGLAGSLRVRGIQNGRVFGESGDELIPISEADAYQIADTRTQHGPDAAKNEAWRLAQAARAKPPSTTGLPEAFAGAGQAIGDNLRGVLWPKVESGDVTENGQPSNLLMLAKAVRQGGGLLSPDMFKAFAARMTPLLSDRTDGWQQRLNQAAETFLRQDLWAQTREIARLWHEKDKGEVAGNAINEAKWGLTAAKVREMREAVDKFYATGLHKPDDHGPYGPGAIKLEEPPKLPPHKPDQDPAMLAHLEQIAQEWEALGDPQMARVVRLRPTHDVVTQQSVDFQRQLLERERIKRNPELRIANAPSETFDPDTSFGGREGSQQRANWQTFLANAQPHALALYEGVRGAMVDLTARLNALGYTRAEASQSNAPGNIVPLRDALTSISGTFARYWKGHWANQAGRKGAKPDREATEFQGVVKALEAAGFAPPDAMPTAAAPTGHPSSHDWSQAIARVLRTEGQAEATAVFNDMVRINDLNPAQVENLLGYTRAATGDPGWTPTPPTGKPPEVVKPPEAAKPPEAIKPPEPPPLAAPADAIVSDDRMAQMRERMRAHAAKMRADAAAATQVPPEPGTKAAVRPQTLPQEIREMGGEYAVALLERGVTNFRDYGQRMVEDLGEEFRPYLRGWYEQARYWPGFDAAGMTPPEQVGAELERWNQESAGGSDNGPGDRPLDQPAGGEAGGEGGGAGEPGGDRPDQSVEGTQPAHVPAPEGGGGAGENGVGAVAPEAGEPGAVHPGGDVDDGRGLGVDPGLADTGAGAEDAGKPFPAVVRPNFHLTDPERLVGGGPKARFARNQAALEAYQAITAEGREPTPAELETIAGYMGWGSFGQELFKATWAQARPVKGWEAEDQWLRQHLDHEAWLSAQRSITNAHYTDPPTVTAMWDIAQKLGFEGGRILEPSVGIGNFFGLMPREIMGRSSLTGIELDITTGGMAKLLYPEAGVHIKAYQDSHTPDNFYDLAIGNWPFDRNGPADRRYDRFAPSLHDYFFLKAVDQVRPGGLVIGITSAGTMDRQGRASRLELARKADLVAAFRLPTGAFKQYAGTSVVTDLIILRKRETPNAYPSQVPWMNSTEMETPTKRPTDAPPIHVNEYFQANPQNVLGTLDWGHGTTSGRPGMIVTRGDNFPALLADLPNRVPAGTYLPVLRGSEPRFLTNNTQDRNLSVIHHDDGKLYQVQGERLVPLEDAYPALRAGTRKLAAARVEQVTLLSAMRRLYGQLIDAERDGRPETEDIRRSLNQHYQVFRDAHGAITGSNGLAVLLKLKDPNGPMVAALERPDGTPSQILTAPTVRSRRDIENPNVPDAYVMARNEQAHFSMARVAELARVPEADATSHLLDSGAVYRTPGGGFEPADLYLSGNVRKKLREAQQALASGEPMQGSITALEGRIPPTVPYYLIEAKAGATWMPNEIYQQWIADLLGIRAERPDDLRHIEVGFTAGKWKVRFTDPRYNDREEAQRIHGHPRRDFNKLIADAMGNRAVVINDPKDDHGGPYFNQEATDEVNAKIGDLRDKFQDWVWKDPERKIALETAYNEMMNAIAKPKFDGSFMDLAGMALTRGDAPFNLRQHQGNAIWRGVVLGRGLFAHEVGTGKTYTMGGIAVEGRRYGVFRKPLIWAHNANSTSVARDIQQMYPGSQVLYIPSMKPTERATMIRRIASEDWDAVIMPHSMIDQLGFRRETLDELAADQIAQLESEAMSAAAEDGVNLTTAIMNDPKALAKVRSPTAKDLVRSRNAIIKKIEQLAQRAAAPDAIPFEELGIDAVMVDECHEFKKPPFATTMKLKGLNTETSDRSIALDFMTKYIKKNNNNRGVFLFTGTPVTNTLSEVFNMARYFMDDKLAQAGVEEWDAWFNTFANALTDVELGAGGDWEPIKRLSAFDNVDELVRQMSEFVDVVQAKDMPEFQPRKTESGKTLTDPDLTDAERDYLMNGRTEKPEGRPYKRIVTDVAEMTPDQQVALNEIRERIASYKRLSKKERYELRFSDPPDRRQPLITDQDGPKASLDIRNYNPDAPDHPNQKGNRIARNVLEIYHADPKAGQAVFVDSGYNAAKASEGRQNRFVMVQDFVAKLVAGGIPRDQIAVVAGATTPEKKYQIAQEMSVGVKRVVIGLSSTLGVGVNMQPLLRAMHHWDAPWRPGDLEQRNGRGERAGNTYNTVLEYRYITEGIDGRRWQVLAAKERFIKQFINAFNDESGKRIGSLEGDAADMSEDEDFTKTLSAAAGDPRIMIRAKLKADVERLEKKERTFTVGVADARQRVRVLHGKAQRDLDTAEIYGRQADQWQAAVERSRAAAAALKSTHALYEAEAPGLEGGVSPLGTAHGQRVFHSGEEIQAAIDAQLKEFVKGDGVVTFATIGGFNIVGNWMPHTQNAIYGIEDAAGSEAGYLDLPTVRRIVNRLNELRGGADRYAFQARDTQAAIPKLQEMSEAAFPQQDKLDNARRQLAKLIKDLRENPVPPPGWLRHGAPVDSDIYVNGQPRQVRGHRMADDYYVVTDEGDVPYMQAKTEAGLPVYEQHPPPPPPAPKEIPEWAQREAINKNGEVAWAEGDLALLALTDEEGEYLAAIKQGEPTPYALTDGPPLRLSKITPKDWDKLTEAGADYQEAQAERQKAEDARHAAEEAGQPIATDQPAFRNWFGDSKVVDAEGNPQVVYHGTTRWSGLSRVDKRPVEFGDVEVFDPHFARKEVGKNPSLDNIGTWFTTEKGDPDQPHHGANLYANQQGAIYPVYLSIKNPLVIEPTAAHPESFDQLRTLWDDWHNKQLANRSRAKAVVERIEALQKLRRGNTFWGDPDGFVADLKAQGHDGIMLRDFRESSVAPAQDAWIAFEPNQVKSAIGNRGGFDPADPRIQFARRKGKAAPAGAPPEPPAARAERLAQVERLRQAMTAMMRHIGLPDKIGLAIVDRLVTSKGDKLDAAYQGSKGLISYALDTLPGKAPTRLWHEAIHALMDEKLGLLSERERHALEVGGRRWLYDGSKGVARRKELAGLGYNQGQMVEEAIARTAEIALRRGQMPRTVTGNALSRIQNLGRGLGQVLAGEGFTTAEDVFRALQTGRHAVAGAEAAPTPRPPPSAGPLSATRAGQMAGKGVVAPATKIATQQETLPAPQQAATQATQQDTKVARTQAATPPPPPPSPDTTTPAAAGPEEEPKSLEEILQGQADEQYARRRQPDATVVQDEPGTQAARRPVAESLKDVAKQAADEIQAVFAPTSRGAAGEMETIVRGRASALARNTAQDNTALERFGRAVGQLPEAEQLDIWHRMDLGQPQPTPELQQVASAIRRQLDKVTRQIQGLGTGALEDANEHYMGRAYSNWAEVFGGQPTAKPKTLDEGAMAGQSKSPIRGSMAFLKGRSFDTLAEAMDAGLKPITSNPVEMQLLKLREMWKFYHGTRMAQEMKDANIAKWIPQHEERAAQALGWTKLDDAMFQPLSRKMGYGVHSFGNWYAPETMAKVFNNYVSEGLAGHSIWYDGARTAGNALNQLQLGFSGFHATFIALDTLQSRMALALQQASRGDLRLAGINAALSLSPTTLVTTLQRGARVRAAYLDPQGADPPWRRLAQLLTIGGGRVNMDAFYHSNASGSFFKSLEDLRNPLGAFREMHQMLRDTPLTFLPRLVGRVLETVTEPIMGQMVPLAKLGVFSMLAEDWQRRNPQATAAETSRAMIEFWDSMDNRMGQLVYDNVFWNKTLKDVAFVTTRSVGWNLGTIRELGGGAKDSVTEAWDAIAAQRKPVMSTRMAYLIAMPIFAGLVGSIVTYLMTGHGPENLLDLYYPPDAKGGRLQIPGYAKDAIAWGTDPVQTALNKTHPLISMASQLYKNEDYYGASIFDPRVDNPLVAYPRYLLNQAMPFSTHAMKKMGQHGADPFEQALAFWGIQPAPKSITEPERGAAYQMRQMNTKLRRRGREEGMFFQ